MELDLASLHSVQGFATSFKKRHLPLHLLVLNAAVFGGQLSKTVDGIERHFAVNHLGHFLLATLLVDTLRDSAPSRVVVVASESHWWVYIVDWVGKGGDPVIKSSLGQEWMYLAVVEIILFWMPSAVRLGRGLGMWVIR